MSHAFEFLDWPEAKKLVAAFENAQMPLRFVGGCVRDALLSRPLGDIDVATPALPESVMKLLENAGIKAIPTGILHGTVTALIDEKKFEITTLRKDIATDGRHAEVAFVDDWKEDAARRDFTMNALYVSPERELFDYFGGETDLRAGIVKFIGDPKVRINEDYLRILRYFRFLAQIGCPKFDATIHGPIYPTNMHVPSYEACAALAEGIDSLSGERIHQEMFKLLGVADLTDDVLMWMTQMDIHLYIFPDYPGGCFETLIPLEREFGLAPDAMRRLCMCISDDEYTSFERQYSFMCNRWKLSNEQARRLNIFTTHINKIHIDTPPEEIKRLKRKIDRQILVDMLVILWSIYQSYGTDAGKARDAFAPLLDIALHWLVPVFPVAGQDLLDAGMKPGKALGKKLRELENLWEAGNYAADKNELLAIIKQ